MLTLPKIETFPARPYVAVRQRVTIPFGEVIGPALDKVGAYLGAKGQRGFGPAIFKYNLIDMPRLEIEFGFLTGGRVEGNDEFISGELPAGRYAMTTYTGHYDNLMDVTAVLIGWAKQKGLEWDSEETAAGEKFVSRVEVYLDGPEGDPATWRTEVAIKLRD
jgi:effector-binding domain-containing protein